MTWGTRVDWQEDDEAPPPRRRAPAGAAPPNRRDVTVVVCPVCASTEVHRHSVVCEVGYWRCACGTRWKESASVGQGRAQIA